MLAYHYTICAEKAFKAAVKSCLAVIALALVAIATLNVYYVSLFLGVLAIVCFSYAVIAANAMRHFYKGAKHERKRNEAHLNPRRIYL